MLRHILEQGVSGECRERGVVALTLIECEVLRAATVEIDHVHAAAETTVYFEYVA